MDYEAQFIKVKQAGEMSQAWCHELLNLRNNLFQAKGKRVRMVNQIGRKVFKG